MTKIAYLQCPTGIAGDMCLGALVDAGVPLEYLTEQLARLGIAQEYKLWTENVRRNGLRANKFHVDLVFAEGDLGNPDQFDTFSSSDSHPHHTHSHHSHPTHSHSHSDHSHPPIRHLPEIEQLILQAQLPTRAETWSLAIFRKLAEAEGAVHGVSPEQVHFHEVGATDALVDIIGTCLGLDWLGVEQLYCSPLPTGGGTIRAAHGRLPVPTPAVLKLFEMGQIPLYSNHIDKELVTPTGAAIAVTLAAQFGPPPAMVLHRVGLGAGSQDLAIANILRLWLGEIEDGPSTHHHHAGHHHTTTAGTQAEPKSFDSMLESSPVSETQHTHTRDSAQTTLTEEIIAVLETQLDDVNPQAIGYVSELLLAAGALDVFTQAIAMKKSRPGTLLTVLCHPDKASTCEAIIFRETTTLGIRRSQQQRQILPRAIETVPTPYGSVRVKVAWANGCDRSPTNVQPEYEDCAQIARATQLPWRQIHQLALQSWYSKEQGLGVRG